MHDPVEIFYRQQALKDHLEHICDPDKCAYCDRDRKGNPGERASGLVTSSIEDESAEWLGIG